MPISDKTGTGRASDSQHARERLITAAAHVIGERGVDATRLIDVARAAGVSIGKIQHYFPAREELLAATFESVNDASIADWERVSSKERDAAKRLSAMLRMAAFGRPGWEEFGWTLWVEFWAVSHRQERFRAQYEIIYAKWRSLLLETVTDGMARGQFTPTGTPQDAVDRIAAVIEGLAIRALLDPAEMPKERVFELLSGLAELELACTLPR